MALQEKPVISYSFSTYESEVFYQLDRQFIEPLNYGSRPEFDKTSHLASDIYIVCKFFTNENDRLVLTNTLLSR